MNRISISSTPPADPIKLMYFAPLPPNASLSSFSQRWRRHGALAMGLSFWRYMARYEQLDALHLAGPRIPHGGASSPITYGGVGIIWFHDLQSLLMAGADPCNDIMRVDELESFGAHLGGLLVPTVEHRIYGSGGADIDLVVKLRRRDGLEHADLIEGLDNFCTQLLALPEFLQHVKTLVKNLAIEGISECDGYLQLGFARAADFTSLAAEPGAMKLWQGLAQVLDRPVEMLLTRRNVLFELPAAERRREPTI